MAKPPSRVAQQSHEAEQQARELERKVRELSTQIANPQKYFAKKPDERVASTVVRFRRYFMLDRASSRVEKRKPTRAEMRGQRNRAIVWLMSAAIIIFWVLGKLLQ